MLFPLLAVCYFGCVGVVMLAGFESLRAGWAVVLAVEVGVLGAFVASRRCWARPRSADGDGDGADEALVGEVEGERGCQKATVAWSADSVREGYKEEGVVGTDQSGVRHV